MNDEIAEINTVDIGTEESDVRNEDNIVVEEEAKHAEDDLLGTLDSVEEGREPFIERPKPMKVVELDIAGLRLSGKKEFERRIHADTEIDARFVQLGTDEIVTYAEGMVQLINLAVDRRADTIFFLDRSARPCGLMFLHLWRRLYPQFRPPHIKFIHIGQPTPDHYNATMSDEAVRIVRERYGDLSGHECIVADEVTITGKTLRKAKSIMSRLYPSIKFTFTTVFPYDTWWQISDMETGELGIRKPKGDLLIANVSKDKRARLQRRKSRHELKCLSDTIADHVFVRPKKTHEIFKPFLGSEYNRSHNMKADVREFIDSINEE